MKTFEFTIIASGLDHEADDFEDRFFEAGCDDATIAFARGAILLHFAREAESIEHAIESAISDVRSAGAQVDRVEPDNLVSLSEIATRANMTKGAISHYSKGARGRGFPHPVARVTTDSPLWDWDQVSKWLADRGKIDAILVAEASAVRKFNTRLEIEQSECAVYAAVH
ncbi:hypothetical protein [Filomicrobium sp.]|uniref:hypothetical protein n=1 Tax=Filomicrobium sp. TaxID=2024831 RepID=UPI00258DDDF1|nr:hypothetical protein [Filomicrobium sp.]MCV0371680.1 hypothetical protein [Filomicrobium sp.]